MFYIVGSTGLISKQIKKILKDKSCYFLSSRKKTYKILKKIKKKRYNYFTFQFRKFK